jgi:hypothetical protein
MRYADGGGMNAQREEVEMRTKTKKEDIFKRVGTPVLNYSCMTKLRTHVPPKKRLQVDEATYSRTKRTHVPNVYKRR